MILTEIDSKTLYHKIHHCLPFLSTHDLQSSSDLPQHIFLFFTFAFIGLNKEESPESQINGRKEVVSCLWPMAEGKSIPISKIACSQEISTSTLKTQWTVLEMAKHYRHYWNQHLIKHPKAPHSKSLVCFTFSKGQYPVFEA